MPYVFYDSETTGTETAFDQILQFAAIKTDDDFVELDRFNIRCRLLPHIVPAPNGQSPGSSVTRAMIVREASNELVPISLWVWDAYLSVALSHPSFVA